jgi:transcriptional regulator GlxA family with amidase domain
MLWDLRKCLSTPNKLHAGEPAYEVEIVEDAEDRTVPTQIGVPIGEWPRDKRHSPDFLRWLREQSTKVRRLGSVCTGALVQADDEP